MNDLQLISLEGDILIKNGDFVIGNGDTQNIHDIIHDAPGEWHQWPNVGVNIFYYLNSPIEKTNLVQQASKQLQSDGFQTQNMILTFDNTNSVETINVTQVYR